MASCKTPFVYTLIMIVKLLCFSVLLKKQRHYAEIMLCWMNDYDYAPNNAKV